MKYLLYVTKAKPLIYYVDNEVGCVEKINGEFAFKTNKNPPALNGHIVAEFEGECEEFEFDTMSREIFSYWYKNGHEVDYNKMCLTYEDLWDYMGDSKGYAIRIKNLKAFNNPFTIEALYQPIDNNYCKKCKEYSTCYYAKSKGKPCKKVLLSAPQNMCYVWYKGELCVLISIRPEWACKILNGEKTIEIRKKVLKECL